MLGADIETYDIDTRLNKVTVTGNVTTEEVIRVLHKIGKQASVWDEDSQISENRLPIPRLYLKVIPASFFSIRYIALETINDTG